MFAASLESLIAFAVIILLSAVGNWIKNRNAGAPREGEEPGDPTAPGRQPPGQPERPAPRPQPGFDWERELRRMFGEEPEPQRPLPPPPPTTVPPVISSAPTAPPVSTPPVTTGRTEPSRPARHSWREITEDAPALDHAEAPTTELATLANSRTAYARARAIQTATQARLNAIKARVEAHQGAVVVGRTASADIAVLVRSFRNPRTTRQAMLAAVILGPPKGSTP